MKIKRFLKMFFFASIFFAMPLTSCVSVPSQSENQLTKIQITHAANKLVYDLNEVADYSGLEVTAYYSIEPESIIPHKQLTFSGFSSATVGDKTITVSFTYKNVTKSDSFVITVRDSAPSNTLERIRVTHSPNKTQYQLGEEADYTGLEITATYSIEPESIIPHSQLTFSGFTTESIGRKTITVSYTYKNATKSTSFEIDVIGQPVENALHSIEITSQPYNKEFEVGEDIDFDGLEVTAHYTLEEDAVIPLSELSVSGYSSEVAGPVTVTLSYTYKSVTKSDSYQVMIVDPQVDNQLVSIEITNPASQLEYSIGDEFNVEGLEVTAHFSDEEDQVIDNASLSFNGFSSETAGEKTISIAYTYKNVTKYASYTVIVFDTTNVTLDFYGFNDRHGVIMDCDYGVGIAKTSTFLKNQTKDKNALFVSSGDMWQGTVESNSNHGELMTRWMKMLDFTSMTVGNHEFDWGTNAIKTVAENVNFPILGINVIDKITGQRADYVSPSTVVYRGGAKIGIIGAIGDCYSSISYSKVMDVEFVLDKPSNNKPLTKLITDEATRLREEEGCDFIVYSFHGDSVRDDTYYNIELSTNHIVDVVFEGHKHVQTAYQDDGGVWHFQSQAEGQQQTINHFTVSLNTSSDEYSVAFNEYSDVYYMGEYDMRMLEEDEETLALIDEYDFTPYRETLGYNSIDRSGVYMRQLCADLYLEEGLKKWTDYSDDIVLAGGYISIRGEGYLPAGDVNYAMFNNLFPFDNDVLLMSVRGDLLINNFIASTNPNYYLAYTDYGNTLRNNGSLIDRDNYYIVITDTYTYDYLYQRNESLISFLGNLKEGGYYARDLFADYARAGRFNEGGGGDIPPVENDGSLAHPYSISDAVSLANTFPTSTTWGYFKGRVTSKQFNLVDNYFQYVELEDLDSSDVTVVMYKLHRHDGDVNPDGVSVYGFKDVNELPAGSELLLYGGIRTYNNAPQFTGVNIAITIDNLPASGQTVDNPTSITNYIQANNLDLADDLYFFGRASAVTKNGSTLTSFEIRSEHNVDYGYSKMENFYRGLGFNSEGMTFTYAEGLSAANVEDNADLVCRFYGENTLMICRSSVTGEEEHHAGTLDDPYTVSEALAVAAQYSASSAGAAGAPWIYCRGVVSRQATRVGSFGDLGNVYIKDPVTGKEILIYFLKRYNGATVEDNFFNTTDLSIGDELLIYGQAFNYNGTTLEFANGTYCITINGVAQGPSA